MSDKLFARVHRVSRRRFLQEATLVSVGVWAAACAPSTTGPTAASPAAKKRGPFHMAWPYDPPPKGHYNYFATGGIMRDSAHLSDLMRPAFATFRWAANKYDFWLAESGKLTGNTYELKLRKDLKWQDGTPLTSKDVVTTFLVGRMEGFTIWRFIDKVEAVDDLTVRFNFAKATSLGERFILKERVQADSLYGAIAKKAQDFFAAGKTITSDEGKALRKELADMRPAAPVATGPFKIDPASVTEAQLTMVVNDKGLFADRVGFDKILVYKGETADITPLVLAGSLDYATHAFPIATDKAMQDAGIKVLRSPLYTGPAIYFHWEKVPQFQDKRLRQAVAHAIDRAQNGAIVYGESAKPPKLMAGVADPLVKTWVSAADQGKLKAYEFDVKKAEDLMKAAGYAKGGDGIWAKDGKKLEFEMTFPSDFTDWSASAQNTAEALNKFGIKITLRGSPRSTQGPEFNDGKFQLAYNAWGTGATTHPLSSLERPLREFNITPAGGGHKYPVKQKTDVAGEVDFNKLLDEMGEGFDQEKQKPAVAKFVLAFNELLPCVPLWERALNSPVNDKERVTGWPALTDPIWTNGGSDNAVSLLIMDGTLKAK